MLTTRKRDGVPRTIVSVDEEWAEDEWLSPDEEYEFILDTDEQEDDLPAALAPAPASSPAAKKADY